MKTAASLGLALASLLSSPALAAPAVVYDMGGKFDKSFNELANVVGNCLNRLKMVRQYRNGALPAVTAVAAPSSRMVEA